MPHGSNLDTGSIPDWDNRMTVWTVMCRVPLTVDFPPVWMLHSSVTTEPGGGILLSNAIAGVSPMSVSSDMCGRS